MKKRMVVASFLASIALSACHQAPLKTMPKEKQVTLLLDASRAAEKELGLFAPPGGGYYLSCMASNEAHIDCQRFFKAMLSFLKGKPALQQLTEADMTNPNFFAEIALDYQQQFFNAIAD